MSRRSFFESLAVLAAAVLAQPLAAKTPSDFVAAAGTDPFVPGADAPNGASAQVPLSAVSQPLVPSPQPQRPSIELQRSPVAGFQFHQGEQLWPLLTVGMPLKLVREADNRHDDRAVRVEGFGLKLGYVPRIDNAAISQLLDRGEVLTAQVVALRESRDLWERVEFSVSLRL